LGATKENQVSSHHKLGVMAYICCLFSRREGVMAFPLLKAAGDIQ